MWMWSGATWHEIVTGLRMGSMLKKTSLVTDRSVKTSYEFSVLRRWLENAESSEIWKCQSIQPKN